MVDSGISADDEYDRLRRRVLWSMPSGLYVVGSRSEDRRNGMTLNWAMQVAIKPKLVAIAVLNSALTHELIESSGVFSLNVLARDDRAIVRKFVKPVEVDEKAATLNGIPFHDGSTGAPVLDQAVAFLECRVTSTLGTGDHSLFVGEVARAGFQRPEDTPILRMEDTRMNYGG